MTQEIRPVPGRVVSPADAVGDVVVGTLSLVVGGVVGAGRAAVTVGRPCARLVLEPPLLPSHSRPARVLGALGRRGRAERVLAVAALDDAITALAPLLVARILRAVPLTDLIRENVDLDAIVADVDLAALAHQVLDAVDLPEIIRQSTGSMTSEALVGVRLQSFEADQTVDRVLGRMHLRRRTRPAGPPAAEDPT
jgi:hypothetical protein